MFLKSLYTQIKHSIFFNLRHLLFLFLYLIPILLIGQDIDQNQNHDISKVFEKKDMKEEIINL